MANANETAKKDTDQLTLFQIGMLIVSLYSISAVFAQTFFSLTTPINKLLDQLDYVVCAFFIYDVSYRFYKADSKLQFMKWGWIDIISSIPMINFLRWGRMIRVIRIVRLLRAFRSTKILLAYLFKNRSKGALITAVLSSILLVVFASIAMLVFETDPASNIKSPADALWWGFATITTIGYGDKYPITTPGRIVAVFLMLAGVGLFGTVTAYISTWFMNPGYKKEEGEIHSIKKEMILLREKLESIDKKLDQ